MYGQQQVLDTIATGHGLAGPLIGTGLRQDTAVEVVRLLVGDVLLEDMIKRRMNADDIPDDRITSMTGRYDIQELAVLGITITLELERIALTDRDVSVAIEGRVDGQVERLHYA